MIRAILNTVVYGTLGGVIGLALALLLAGCGQPTPPPAPEVSVPLPAGKHLGRIQFVDVYRFHDDEAGATCWISKGYNSGGISCVPDSQLKER